MDEVKRKFNFFEIFLLFVGIVVIFAGSYALNMLIQMGVQIQYTLIYIVLWLLLIVAIIISAISENSREELGIIIQENNREIKLLRDISREHLEEIKMLKEVMKTKK